MMLSDNQKELFIQKLVNDTSICDEEWEKKYQHLRDDLCVDNVDINRIHYFHLRNHGINVISLAKKYGVI